MDTVRPFFAPDLIEYAFVGVSHQTQNLWENIIKMNQATQFTYVCASQITGICAIIQRPKKVFLSLWSITSWLCIDTIPEAGRTKARTKVSKPKRYSLSKLRLDHAPLNGSFKHAPHVYITMWEDLHNTQMFTQRKKAGFSNRSSVEAAVSGRRCVSRRKKKHIIWPSEGICI